MVSLLRPKTSRQPWWARSKRWIDKADYDHLIRKLATVPDPEVIYLSGMIAWNNRAFLGPWYLLPRGTPDKVGTSDEKGLYEFRFIDPRGTVLKTLRLPANWNGRETEDAGPRVPVTFFGFKTEYPAGTQQIQIWNLKDRRLLGHKIVSSHRPAVRILAPLGGPEVVSGTPITVTWLGIDPDRTDTLTSSVFVSPNGLRWWPVAHRLVAPSYTLRTDGLNPGGYYIKVLVNDGVRVGESQVARFSIRSAR